MRVASTLNMVDLSGPQISAQETVTVLNDMCLMAPGSLIDVRLTWTAVDRHTADVTFANGRHSVAGRIVVNDAGELTDFWSDDRPDSSGGGFNPMRWSTPISQYRDAGHWHVISQGSAVHDRPDGRFTYGSAISGPSPYDVLGPLPD